MERIRVSAVAGDLGISPRDALHELHAMGHAVKTPSSTIDASLAAALRRRMRSKTGDEDVPRGGWEEFGGLVARLRRQRGWTQAELGQAVGAGGSWVSQVESGSLVPGPDRTVRLGVVLGPEVSGLAAQLRGERTADGSAEPRILALLWRGRAELLGRMAAASRSRPARLRFDRLSRDLLAAASAHPSMSGYLDRAQLRPLSVLAEGASAYERHIVAVELATMKIDAPYEAETDLESRLDLIDFVLEDLGLLSAHAPLREAVMGAVRKRPSWSELPSCGGPLGMTSMIRAALDQEQLLLIGHDPAGWLGAEFAGGAWLIPPAERPRNAASIGLFDSGALPNLAAGDPGAGPGIAVAGAAAAGLGILLPVVTPLVLAGAMAGAAAGAAALSRKRRRFEESMLGQAANTDGRLPVASGQVALAFGWAWTRVETTKLLALYSIFREQRQELPDPAQLGAYMQAQATQVLNEAEQERELSGTGDLDRNAPLRNLVDVADSLAATAQALRSIKWPTNLFEG